MKFVSSLLATFSNEYRFHHLKVLFIIFSDDLLMTFSDKMFFSPKSSQIYVIIFSDDFVSFCYWVLLVTNDFVAYNVPSNTSSDETFSC